MFLSGHPPLFSLEPVVSAWSALRHEALPGRLTRGIFGSPLNKGRWRAVITFHEDCDFSLFLGRVHSKLTICIPCNREPRVPNVYYMDTSTVLVEMLSAVGESAEIKRVVFNCASASTFVFFHYFLSLGSALLRLLLRFFQLTRIAHLRGRWTFSKNFDSSLNRDGERKNNFLSPLHLPSKLPLKKAVGKQLLVEKRPSNRFFPHIKRLTVGWSYLLSSKKISTYLVFYL